MKSFMKSILLKLLAKRGIKSVDELDAEEKATFQEWDKILSKEELTLEDVKEYCKTQCAVIEGKWKDYGTANVKKAEWIPYHTVYKTLLAVIESPKSAREALEQNLNNLIK